MQVSLPDACFLSHDPLKVLHFWGTVPTKWSTENYPGETRVQIGPFQRIHANFYKNVCPDLSPTYYTPPTPPLTPLVTSFSHSPYTIVTIYFSCALSL